MSNDTNPGPPVVPGYPSPADTAAYWDRTFNPGGPITDRPWTSPQPGAGDRPWTSPGAPPWQTETVRRGEPKRFPVWAWALIAVGAVLALCMIGGALATGGTPSPEQSKVAEGAVAAPAGTVAPAKTKAAAPVYKMGQPIRGGDFTFTVNSKKCGIAQVGSEYLNVKAQGSFCRLELTVQNVTKEPHTFDAETTVKVRDTQGRTFNADSEAGIYGNQNAAGFLDQINPGNKVRAFVYFDVAGGVKLKSVTFDAGLFTMAKDVTVPF